MEFTEPLSIAVQAAAQSVLFMTPIRCSLPSMFGVVPAIIGWVALAVALHFGAPALALFLLLVGFFLTIVVETIGRGRNVVAGNYLALRWGASIVVLIVLLVVLFKLLSGMQVG